MTNQTLDYKKGLESAAEFLFELKDKYFSGTADEFPELEHDMNHFEQYCMFSDLIYQVICHGDRDSVILAMIPYRYLYFIAFSEDNVSFKENAIYQTFAIDVFATFDRLIFTGHYKDIDVPSRLHSNSFDLSKDTPKDIYIQLKEEVESWKCFK